MKISLGLGTLFLSLFGFTVSASAMVMFNLPDGEVRWSEEQALIPVFFKIDSCPGILQQAVEESLPSLFQAWNEIPSLAPELVLTQEEDKALIRIICDPNFGEDSKKADASHNPAYAAVAHDGRFIQRVTMKLNTARNKTALDRKKKSRIKQVVSHELGHSLGLLKHDRNRRQIMHEAGAPDTRSFKPQSRDRARLIKIYGDLPEAL